MNFLRCALKRKVLRTTGKSSYIALTLIEIGSQNEYGHLHKGVPIPLNPLYTGRPFTIICRTSPRVILGISDLFVLSFYFLKKILFTNNVDPLDLHCLAMTFLQASM